MPSADSIAGIRAVTSAMVCPRASRSRARHPHRSTVADWILEPGRPMALEMSGHAASARCTRTRARRRRCAHHGTASRSAPMPSTCGIGAVNGPSSAATASHPPAASTATAA